jgi:purine-binding chemotaxis protein CheW
MIAVADRPSHIDADCSDAGSQYATFRVGALRLGVDIRHVQEINRGLAPRRVPHAPPAVSGVANLRGEVITLFDMRTLLGLEPETEAASTRCVVIRSNEESIGLVVDEICDVVRIPDEELAPTPPNFAGADSRRFRAVHQTESGLLVLLDAEELLRGA